MRANTALHQLDGLDLLAGDHEALRRLFREFERFVRRKGEDDDSQALLADRICHQYSLHSQIEEEILYPLARSVLGGLAVLSHVEIDHCGAREFIARIDEMEPGDPDRDAAIAVLEDYVLPHMAEEEAELFPALRAAGVDVMAMGARIARRRRALLGDVTRLGLPDPAPVTPPEPGLSSSQRAPAHGMRSDVRAKSPLGPPRQGGWLSIPVTKSTGGPLMLNSNFRTRTGGYRFVRAGAFQATSESQSPRAAPVQGGINEGFTPLSRRSAFEAADMNELLDAVKSRLRLCVAGRPEGHDAAGTVRSSVLECAAALDLLQVSLARELNRHQEVELEVFDAQAALAQARVELASTQAVELRARHRALHDSLTSLPNRSLLRQRLDDALVPSPGRRQALAVLYVDLDDFKPINDTHGREVGDELLRIVSARLVRAVRNGDLVSRLGGDEFACLLAELPGRQQLRQLACKLFDAVSAPVTIGTLELTVRPSIGIAVCPGDGVTSADLLRSADAAMVAARREQSGYAFAGQVAAGQGSD